MSHHYTAPVSNALNGARATHNARAQEPYLAAGTSSGKEIKRPDMRPRPSDLRSLQKLGFLPDPYPHDDRGKPASLFGFNYRSQNPGTWLFASAAQTGIPQSPAQEDDIGQTALPKKTSCHLNPRAAGLFNWLKRDKDPRFWMTLSPVFENPQHLPPLQGTVILLGVRSNSQRFADGVQELVDEIKATACDAIPILLLDFPVPHGVNPKHVSKRPMQGAITQDQVDAAQRKVYQAIADIQLGLGKSGAKPHVSPIPGNLDGKQFVDFYTKWAQRVKDPAVKGAILDDIKRYDRDLDAYTAITNDLYQQMIRQVIECSKEPGAQDKVILAPIPDRLFRNMEMKTFSKWCPRWCKLGERLQFESEPQ